MQKDKTLDALRELFSEYDAKANPVDSFSVSELSELWKCHHSKARRLARAMVSDGRLEDVEMVGGRVRYRFPSQ